MNLSEQQRETLRPIAARFVALTREADALRYALQTAVAMVEPLILDPESGVGFDADTLTITYAAEPAHTGGEA